MLKLISKTDYLVWRDCPHNAWMKKWKPDIYYALPPSEFDQNLIATGNQVEEKAREFFGDGTLIEGRDEQSLKKTKELLLNKTGMLFQACFSDGTLFSAADILKQGKDGELYIYEVKASSTSKKDQECSDGEVDEDESDTIVDFMDIKAVKKYEKKILKDPHLYDLAFQIYLIKKSGYKVSGGFIVRLNKGYVRGENLNLKKLFVVEDVLKYVDQILPTVENDVEKMIKDLTSTKDPEGPCNCIFRGRSKHCTTFNCLNEKIIGKDIIKYSVHDISRIGSSKVKLKDLIDRKVYDILEVPDDIEFSEKMHKQIRVHKRGKAEIDYIKIKNELDTLIFPLYFLDYESFNPAIPRFLGYKPYQQIPFQFSLHILTKEAFEKGMEPEKAEPFFYAEQDDPSRLFVEHLKKYIGKVGSIIVWNKTFEESHVNKHLAIRLPEYADFIYSVNSRIFDLMTIFSKQLHIHPDFHGSASIKNVLPVLCPELSYKELDIGNGSEAMNTWNRMVVGDMSEGEKEETKMAMLEYCNLDTYAMYAIFKHLKDLL